MQDQKTLNYIQDVLKNMPSDWLKLTTHRLDIYEERLAKVQFLEQFEELFSTSNVDSSVLSKLPTAYDYIRLGHPLSCVLEWAVANLHETKPKSVISFSSKTTPILAVLRKNLFENKKNGKIKTPPLSGINSLESIPKRSESVKVIKIIRAKRK